MSWLKSIVLVFACALCSSVLADDRAEPDRLAQALAETSLFGENESRAVDDEQLEKLRGRLQAPMGLQQLGVVLWDEPRKGLPPQRNGGESPQLSNIDAGAMILR